MGDAKQVDSGKQFLNIQTLIYYFSLLNICSWFQGALTVVMMLLLEM